MFTSIDLFNNIFQVGNI